MNMFNRVASRNFLLATYLVVDEILIVELQKSHQTTYIQYLPLLPLLLL